MLLMKMVEYQDLRNSLQITRISKFIGYLSGSSEILVGVDSFLLTKRLEKKIKTSLMMLINLYLCRQKEEID
jgi:hypothetical protein